MSCTTPTPASRPGDATQLRLDVEQLAARASPAGASSADSLAEAEQRNRPEPPTFRAGGAATTTFSGISS